MSLALVEREQLVSIYFVASIMKEKDVFEQVSTDMSNVINFIKQTHFYNLL